MISDVMLIHPLEKVVCTFPHGPKHELERDFYYMTKGYQ